MLSFLQIIAEKKWISGDVNNSLNNHGPNDQGTLNAIFTRALQSVKSKVTKE